MINAISMVPVSAERRQMHTGSRASDTAFTFRLRVNSENSEIAIILTGPSGES